MLKKLALIFVLLIASCSPSHVQIRTNNCTRGSDIPSSDAPNSVQNEFGSLVMWDQNAFPIRVVVDLNMREKRKEVVRQAILAWNQTTGLEVFSYEEGRTSIQEGTVFVNEELLPRNECGHQIYGLARRFFRTDIFGIQMAIVRGTIRLHADVPDDRILSTTIHELGHALGLHHDAEIESIMFPHNNGQRGFISNEDRDYVVMMITSSREDMFLNFDIDII